MKKIITLFAVVLVASTTAFAQNGGEKAQPPNGLSEVQAYSLYYTDFRNEDYKGALENGRWILINMPRKIEGYPQFELSTNLDRFTTIYSELAAKQTDPSLKTTYIDSADIVYDKALNTFSADELDYYQWHISRGRMYQRHADYIENSEAKINAEYKKAFDLNPQKMVESDNGYYVKVLLQNMVSEGSEESKQEALAMIKKVEGAANEDLQDYFDKIRNKLFDSPEERMTFLEGKLQENPEDTEIMRQLRDIYEGEDMIAKAQELNKKLYEMNPSYQNASALANYAIQNANYGQAIEYLNEAANKTEDAEKLKTIYQSIADAHMNQGNLRQARSFARKALEIDPNLGSAYITIADAYAQAVRDCSSNRDLTRNDRAVYWLVIDYLNKAKNVDSSVTASVNSRVQTFRQAAPTGDDIFFMDSWSEGGSIRIDSSLNSCYSWINESTTVREF